MFSKTESTNHKAFPIHGWYLFAAIALVLSGVITATAALASKPSGASYSGDYKAVAPNAPRTTSLAISQVYGGGGNSGAYWRNDFVELFNPTQSTINFTNWSVQYGSATLDTWQVNPISGTIPPGGYFLVQLAAGANMSATPLPTPDAIGTTNLGATAGKIALVNSITQLTCVHPSCHNDGSVVDFVGYGATANDFEGTGPAPAPGNTISVVRADSGCQDTNDNANDFAVSGVPPAPRNSSSPTHLCPPPPTDTPGPSSTPTITNTPTITPTPYPTCGTGSDYVITSSTGATIVPGDTDIGNHCTLCTTQITLPFTVNFYGIPFNAVNAAPHGNLQFISTNSSFSPVCLPSQTFNYPIFAFWADQNTANTTCTTCGIFTSTTGNAPNRVFNIEWRTFYFGTTTTTPQLDYEVQFLEGSNQFNIIYGLAPANTGFQLTVGVQRATGISYTQYYCGTDNGLTSGLELTFQPQACFVPTFTPTATPTLTATPTAFPTCGPGSEYVVIPSSGATIVPGVDDTGNHCSACTTQISLPFPVRVYGIPFNTVNASNTGNLQFLSTNSSFNPVCLPYDQFNYAILPYWVDQNTVNTGSCTGCGIFTSTTGNAPNRVFNIEWRTVYYGTSISVNYEVQFLENSDAFSVIYGSAPPYGSSTTSIGVQRATGLPPYGSYTQYYCGVAGQDSGLMLTFRPLGCGEPTFTPTATATATNTPTPVPTCGVGSDYVITSGTSAIDPGTVDIGNHCNNCITIITLPFTYNFYGVAFNTANVSSKGNMQFISTSTAFSNVCLPTPSFNYAMMPYWDDLQTVSALTSTVPTGVFTSISGSAPNRVLNVEWRACINVGGSNPPPCDDTDTNFEIRLHEGGNFEYVYGAMVQNGSGATVGSQRGQGQTFTQYECNTASLSSGLQLTFSTIPCAPTATPTPAGVVNGHLTWQGIAQPSANNVGVTGTLVLCNGASQVYSGQSTTNNMGNITFLTGLPNGTYTWHIKGVINLGTSGSLTISGGTATVEFGLLRAGDSNNSNNVNATDFNILKNSFGKAPGQSGYDDRANYNRDAVVNATDFNLMKNNFGQAGAAQTCP